MKPIEQIIKRIKARKVFNAELLRKIRWQMVKDERSIWFLLVFALIFPALPLSQCGIGCAYIQPLWTLLDNVCYGYIAGMLFYFLSDFRPKSLKVFKSKQKLAETYRSIHTEFKCIADTLHIIDGNGTLVSECEKIAKSVLVKEDNGCVVADEEVLGKIKACFILIQRDVADVLFLYQDVLTSEELKNLNMHNHVYEKLYYSSLPGCVSSGTICVSPCDLDYFVSDLCLNYNIVKRLAKQYGAYMFNAKEFDEKNPVDELVGSPEPK